MPKIKTNKQPFGQWLKEWRERMGYSQSMAAKELKIKVRTYQGWEINRGCPMEQAIRMLATGLEGGSEPEMTRGSASKNRGGLAALEWA